MAVKDVSVLCFHPKMCGRQLTSQMRLVQQDGKKVVAILCSFRRLKTCYISVFVYDSIAFID